MNGYNLHRQAPMKVLCYRVTAQLYYRATAQPSPDRDTEPQSCATAPATALYIVYSH